MPLSFSLVSFAEEVLAPDHLTEGQREILESFETGDYQELLLNVGRRSGKSLIADIIALADVTMRGEEVKPYLREGESRIIAIVAARQDQAAEHIRILSEMVRKSDSIRPLLVRENKTELVFANGSIIRIYPCSARSIRGIACSSVILDEFGHFEEVETSQAAGHEIMRSVAPCLAQFKDKGWLIVISTPDWRNTEFGRMVTEVEQMRPEGTLYFHRTTAQMRPDLADWLEKQRKRHPLDFAQEFEALFKDASGSYLPSEHVIRAVRRGIRRLQPQDHLRYVAAIDPAFSIDRFAMAVAHKDPEDGRIIIDGIWIWHGEGVRVTLRNVAAICEEFRIQEVLTDQHAIEAIREGLDEYRLYSNYKPWTAESKANAFGRLRLGLDKERIELPDDPAMVSELCSLEAKQTPSGGMRIAARSGHDDRAVVVASVVNALDRPDGVVAIFAGDDWKPEPKDPEAYPAAGVEDSDGDRGWPKSWGRSHPYIG